MTDPLVFENKKAAYYTLGCKLNFAETSTIGRKLLELGVRRAKEGEEADICVVNTCSVTSLADKKSRTLIRKIRRQHPRAFLVVTGCYAQLKPEEILDIEGVDLVLGSNEKLDIVRFLQGSDIANKSANVFHTKTSDIRVFSPSCSTDDRTRHFLKVQDGCDYYCTYCTIPAARGRSRNGSVGSLVAQVEEVVRQGGKEVVLTGVNIGDFGRTTGESLIDLLRALDGLEGIERYRIGSIEPNLLSDDIIEFVAQSQRFAPHFHLPLQSGSDEVLRLMHRRYDTKLFADRVTHIRSVLPRAFIGVDVIAGSRGETLELFNETYRFLEGLPFSALHVFTYSERAGTAALKIEPSVSTREKHLRTEKLIALSQIKNATFTAEGVGYRYRVLWEQATRTEEAAESEFLTGSPELMVGFTENYLHYMAPLNPELIGRVTEEMAKSYDERTGSLRS